MIGKVQKASSPQVSMQTNSASDTDTVSMASSAEGSNKQTRTKRPKRAIGENPGDAISMFQAEIRDMFIDFTTKQDKKFDAFEKRIKSELKSQSNDIRASYKNIEASIDFISGQLANVELKITALDQERKDMAVAVSRLEDKIDAMERESTKTCIQIRGVPKRQRETKSDLNNIIENVFRFVQMDYGPTVLRDAFRLPSKQEQNVSTVVAEFSNTFVKADLLNKLKLYTKSHPRDQLQASILGLESASPIYISDHLTPKMRRLHYLARELVRNHGYAFCWTSNGRVYVRKQEGQPYVYIKSERQIDQLKNDK